MSNNISAFEQTKDLYYGPHTCTGPRHLMYDFIWSRSWNLLTHGGFLTYAHHDANGQMTWTAQWCKALGVHQSKGHKQVQIEGSTVPVVQQAAV